MCMIQYNHLKNFDDSLRLLLSLNVEISRETLQAISAQDYKQMFVIVNLVKD